MTKPADHAAAHWCELDGLRAMAIGMVLVNHLFVPKATGAFSTVLNVVLSPSWLGVDLFFVLSGYLITGILLRARSEPHYFARFYLRRTLRIFPAYYAVLILVLLGLWWMREPAAASPSPVAIALYLSYLQNWWPIWLGSAEFRINADPLWGAAAHFWSLGVEEQFYLLWPLFITLLPRQQMARSLALIYLLVLGCKLALWLSGADFTLLFYGTLSRADALILGALVAAREHEKRALLPVQTVWAGVFLALLAVAVHGYYAHLWPRQYWTRLFAEAVPLSALAALWFAWFLGRLRAGGGGLVIRRALSTATMAWLARLSYSLYLVHMPIQHLVTPKLLAALQGSGWSPNVALMITGALVLPLCVAAAMLLHHGLELPLLRRRQPLESVLLRPPM